MIVEKLRIAWMLASTSPFVTSCALIPGSEIFAKLGRLDPGGFRQSCRRHRINSILAESLHNSEVKREPVDGFPGDYKLRHL
jgi:hypothetical protein